MKTLIFLIAMLLSFAAIAPAKTVVKVMPPIQPTTLGAWIDTCAARYNVPAKVIRFVGWHESHMGCSNIARTKNNLFGIRKRGTWAAYPSKFDSVEDFCNFIHKYYPSQIGKTKGEFVLWGYRGKGKHWRVKL